MLEQIWIIPVISLSRAILGWAENAAADKIITWPEWQQLIQTVVRMGTPMLALIYGLNVDPIMAAGLVTIADFIGTKLYHTIK